MRRMATHAQSPNTPNFHCDHWRSTDTGPPRKRRVRGQSKDPIDSVSNAKTTQISAVACELFGPAGYEVIKLTVVTSDGPLACEVSRSATVSIIDPIKDRTWFDQQRKALVCLFKPDANTLVPLQLGNPRHFPREGSNLLFEPRPPTIAHVRGHEKIRTAAANSSEATASRYRTG